MISLLSPLLTIVLLWLILSIIIGYAASVRGRSGGGWFFMAIIFSPLIAGLLLALFPSLAPPTLSLEAQIRERMLEQRYASFIRSHKPAFSSRVVHEVTLGGVRTRFRTKAEAIAFCMSRMPIYDDQLGQQTTPQQDYFIPPQRR